MFAGGQTPQMAAVAFQEPSSVFSLKQTLLYVSICSFVQMSECHSKSTNQPLSLSNIVSKLSAFAAWPRQHYRLTICLCFLVWQIVSETDPNKKIWYWDEQCLSMISKRMPCLFITETTSDWLALWDKAILSFDHFLSFLSDNPIWIIITIWYKAILSIDHFFLSFRTYLHIWPVLGWLNHSIHD